MDTINLLALLLSLALLAGFIRDVLRLRLGLRLSLRDDERAVSPLPFVSIIIPARNEERTIVRCLEHVLALNYDSYEVIVVDDDSTDATPDLLAGYAAREPGVRVVHGKPLPTRWKGKPHACQQAWEVAQGDWLLFLDADTAPQPDLLLALLARAERDRLDMVSLFPFLELESFWERVIMPAATIVIVSMFPPEYFLIPDAPPERVAANGQCILVRRVAYAAIGGHRAVANEMSDDIRLAQALRRAGFRVGGATGIAYLRVRMYRGGREVVEGMTKNALSGAQAGGFRPIWVMLRQGIQAPGPWVVLAVGLIGGDSLVLTAGVLVFLLAVTLWGVLTHRLYALPWWWGLLWPLGIVAYLGLVVRNWWLFRRNGGVEWKGRRYTS